MTRHDPRVRVRHMLNFDILWKIVQDDVPPLIRQLAAIVEEVT